MVLEQAYLDISSSDDDEEDHNQGLGGTLGPVGPLNSKVSSLAADDDDDDDDDVVIIDKLPSTGTVKKIRLLRSAVDDDDCCMLDTDPGATETIDIVPPGDSDELVMTGEKGPVACRDFPHARYLCVHFPFKTTPHANFCTQCHCYVCDSLAPCSSWGDGNSSNDHCHASEEARWKTLRKIAKCGSVPPRVTPITVAAVAAVAAQAASTPLSNLSGVGNLTGGTRLDQSSLLHTHVPSTLPISSSPISNPVGSVVLREVQSVGATFKKDPLVIRLKGNSRGRPSQHPHHLGVRSSITHRHLPLPFPGNRSLPLARSTSAPTGRIRDEVILPINHSQSQQIPPPPQFAPYSNPVPGRAGSGSVADMPPHPPQPLPALNTLPGVAGGVAVMSLHFPQTALNPNVSSYYTPLAPPLPNSPPPYIPPPPPGAYNHPPPVAYDHRLPGVYDYPPPVTYDYSLRLSDAEATVAGFVPPVPPVPPVPHIPDSRYVSASDFSTSQVCNVNIAPLYEDHSNSQPFAVPKPNYSSDYLVQDYRSPADSAPYASSSYISSNGGNVDILAGPTEGWEADAAAHFDAFAPGIDALASPDHNQQGPTSLNDVLEQIAGDDYLWEQFPCWL